MSTTAAAPASQPASAPVALEPVEHVRDRSREWVLPDGRKHRAGAPAVVYTDRAGDEEWWHLGQRHRLNGPAATRLGKKEWWVDGVRHREGAPAVITGNGARVWWHHGQQHRVGGPAVEYAHGTQEWWVEGKEHRLDGPSAYYASSSELRFCVHGTHVPDPDGVLAGLHHDADAGHAPARRELEALLTAWHPGGADLAEVLAAVRAAHG